MTRFTLVRFAPPSPSKSGVRKYNYILFAFQFASLWVALTLQLVIALSVLARIQTRLASLPGKTRSHPKISNHNSHNQRQINAQLPPRFRTISMTAVLGGQIPANLVRDRIILIGSMADSVNDRFYTSYRTHLTSLQLGIKVLTPLESNPYGVFQRLDR